MSAGTRSPPASITMSPGTSSTLFTRIFLPSRRTTASATTIFMRASSALSAFDSWRKPMMAFTTTTMKITLASTHSPRNPVTTAAAISTSTRGAVNCRASRTHEGVPPRTLTRFSPKRSSLTDASALVSPVSSEPPVSRKASQVARSWAVVAVNTQMIVKRDAAINQQTDETRQVLTALCHRARRHRFAVGGGYRACCQRSGRALHASKRPDEK